MSSKKTKKPLILNVAISNDKIMKHVTDAYGLVCAYRNAQQVQYESFEKWAERLLVEGANAIFNYHNAMLKKQAEDKVAAENNKEEEADGKSEEK